MKQLFLTAALSLLGTTQLLAQNKLYAKNTDNFQANKEWSTDEYDSIVFKKNMMYLYKDVNGVTRRSSCAYKNYSYFSFEDPGRIIYKPNECKAMDFNNENSRWCWQRSRQSEHFIVFWEKGFGNDPATSDIKLDVDQLLERSEKLFHFYADSLGFVIPGNSRSTDKYKIMIMVNYSNEWLATGAGYDDTIGALWCTPWALQASGGHTVGHEIGHSFQYLVSCDLGTNHGWRWGFGANGSGGCAWWESCAQWQGFKVYPDQQFTNERYAGSINLSYENILNEEWRYENFFIQDYWCMLHGMKFIGQLWRASTYPEDPVETYKRITGADQNKFNDEIFDYAQRACTWDIDGIRERGMNYQDAFTAYLTQSKEDEYTWQVDSSHCVENYGINIIRMNPMPGGTVVKAHFKGINGTEGYRNIHPELAGWRYGFCAQREDGSRVYGEAFTDKEGTAKFTTPDNCKKLWFVVTGAPTEHFRHPWDDDKATDEQWPYQVTFEGTNRYGFYGEYPADYVRKDTTVSMDMNLPVSASSYDYVNVQLDMGAVSQALGLSTEQMKKLGRYSSSNPSFFAISPSGTKSWSPLTSTSSDSYFGHWFNASGSICGYGSSSYIYSEIDRNTFIAHLGQYPGRLVKGRTYTIRQGIRYKDANNKFYTATFIIKVHAK